jgi:hypothetical protein
MRVVEPAHEPIVERASILHAGQFREGHQEAIAQEGGLMTARGVELVDCEWRRLHLRALKLQKGLGRFEPAKNPLCRY